MKWRMMDTAPKDGKPFLAWGHYGPFVCHWRENPYGNSKSGWGIETDCTTVWCPDPPLAWAEIEKPDLNALT